MSLSRERTTSPIKKYIEWKSSENCFQYYDKEKGEKVNVPLPVKFFILDELTCIKGFEIKNTCGIYSNEIHDTSKEILVVNSFKGGVLGTGLYKDIKDNVVNKGGKYCKSVYANLDGELVNFQLVGSALSFIGDLQKVNKKDHFITVEKSIEAKTGVNTYNVPVFQQGDNVGSKIFDESMAMDEILQEFLDSKKESKENDDLYKEGSTVFSEEGRDVGGFAPGKMREPKKEVTPF